MRKAVQVVLVAPIKLPGKATVILGYVAVGLDVLNHLLDEKNPDKTIAQEELPDETIN